MHFILNYNIDTKDECYIAPGVGIGASLFLLDTMVASSDIEICIEMSQQFCPGLKQCFFYLISSSLSPLSW